MKLYSMSVGPGEGRPLHAVAFFGPDAPKPGMGYRSVCSVYAQRAAGDWPPHPAKGRPCPACIRWLAKAKPIDPRPVRRGIKIFTKRHGTSPVSITPELRKDIRQARQEIEAEDRAALAAEAMPQLIGGSIPEGCAGPPVGDPQTARIRAAIEREVQGLDLAAMLYCDSTVLTREEAQALEGAFVDALAAAVAEALEGGGA
jgi:hypothetical protein